METKSNRQQNRTEAPIVRYLHARAAAYDAAATAIFEITPRCNFSCRMCYVHGSDCNCRAAEELTLQQWTAIAEQAAEAGVMFVLITGGEPMIRPDFADIYTMLIKKGFVVSINTNLSLMTKEHLALFKKYPPNRINASLYGTSNETYTALCGTAAYEKVRAGIEALSENKIPVKINCSVTPYNCGDFEGVAAFCREKDIPLAAASYMFPAARLTESRERLTPEDAALYRVLNDYRQLDMEAFLARAAKIEGGMEYIDSDACIDREAEMTGVRCRGGSSAVWIDYKGNMSMCGMVPADESNHVLTKGFAECRRAVNAAVKAITMPPKCTGCRYRYFCSVCAAACLSETGGFQEPPAYICRMSACTAAYYKQYANKLKGGSTNED